MFVEWIWRGKTLQKMLTGPISHDFKLPVAFLKTLLRALSLFTHSLLSLKTSTCSSLLNHTTQSSDAHLTLNISAIFYCTEKRKSFKRKSPHDPVSSIYQPAFICIHNFALSLIPWRNMFHLKWKSPLSHQVASVGSVCDLPAWQLNRVHPLIRVFSAFPISVQIKAECPDISKWCWPYVIPG